MAAYFFLRYALGDDGLPSLVLGGLAAGGALGTKAVGVVFVPPAGSSRCSSVVSRAGLPRRRATALAADRPRAAGHGRLLVRAERPADRQPALSAPCRGVRAGLARRLVRPGGDAGEPLLPPGRRLAGPGRHSWWPSSTPGWCRSGWPRSPGPGGGAGATGGGRAWIWAARRWALANVALYWVCIPYRTQQRFMLQALGLAVVPLALTLGGRGPSGGRRSSCWPAPAHPPGLAVLRAGGPIPWDLSPDDPERVARPDHPARQPERVPGHLGSPMSWGPTVANGAARLPDRLGLERPARSADPEARRTAAGLTVAAVALLVAYPGRSTSPRGSALPLLRDYLPGLAATWNSDRARPARVAYAGTNLPYYLMGWAPERGPLRQRRRPPRLAAPRLPPRRPGREAARTGRTPDPAGTGSAPTTTPGSPTSGAERIQVPVRHPRQSPRGSHNIADPEGFPIERRWADAHPETFQLALRRGRDDRNVRIYLVRPSGP